MNKKRLRISVSDQPVTTTQDIAVVGGRRRVESYRAIVDEYYLKPLKQLGGRKSLLVLLVLFPIYEKYLRRLHGMNRDATFSKGCTALKSVGKHLGMSTEEAYQFWRNVRNGILHSAFPYSDEGFTYGLRTNGPPIEVIDGCFWINAFALRDRVLLLIEADMSSWDSPESPIPRTFFPD